MSKVFTEPKRLKDFKDGIYVKLVWSIGDRDYCIEEEHYFESEWKDQVEKWISFLIGFSVLGETYRHIALAYQWDLDIEIEDELDEAFESGYNYVIKDSNDEPVFEFTNLDIEFLQLLDWRHPMDENDSYCEIDSVYVIELKDGKRYSLFSSGYNGKLQEH